MMLLLSNILTATSVKAQSLFEAGDGGQEHDEITTKTTRIVGGSEAEVGRHSYAVSLQHYDDTLGV
jgi:hypothetical protein